MKKVLHLVLGLMLIVALTICGCAKEEKAIRIVMTPGGSPLQEEERWRPMMDYLSEALEMPVELIVTTDYSTAVTAFVNKDVQILGKIGTLTYVKLAKECDIEIIAAQVRAKTGTATYTSRIITRADSGIKTLDDIKGKTFAFVDVGSTSGYLIPLAMFRAAGIDPEIDCSRIYFAGAHDLVIEAIVNKAVDAGCCSDIRWDIAIGEEVFKEGELIILDESGPLPNDTVVVAKDLDPELKEKIRNAYLNMPQEVSMETYGILKYIEVDESYYDYVYEVYEYLEMEI